MSRRAELRRQAKETKKSEVRYYITEAEIQKMAKKIANGYIKENLYKHAQLILELHTQIVYEALRNVAGYGRKRLTRVHREIERLSTKTSMLHDRKNYDAIYDWYDSLGVDARKLAVVPADYQRYPDVGEMDEDELEIEVGQ